MSNRLRHFYLFCDETGSTGPNYLDESQPFYVAAGVALAAERVADCRAYVDKQRGSRRAKELKGSGLMGDRRGRQFAVDLVRGLYSRGAMIAFTLVEKRYALAAWFVNIFLDADAEGKERTEYNRNGPRQRWAAQTIARLPFEALAATNAAIRAPTEENQRLAREPVVEALRNMGETRLAGEVETSALPSPALEADDEVEATLLRLGQSPNTAGYMTLLANYQRITSGVGATKVDVIHDETASFEETYRHYYNLASNSSEYARLRPWLEPAGFPHLALINASFVDSETEPLVQAADVIAAGLSFSAQAAVAGRPRDRATMMLFGLMEKSLVPADAVLPWKWQVASEEFDRQKARFDELLKEAEQKRTVHKPEFGG